MRKLLLTALLPLCALCLHGQEVYNYVLESATRVVNNPTSTFTQTQIAQFKRTALIYLRRKAFETQPQVTEQFLNEQAYYLSEFVTLFLTEAVGAQQLSESQRKLRIVIFMEASRDNPLFGDTDTETVEAYIGSGSELTPFSLDTDWMRAYSAARTVLDNLK